MIENAKGFNQTMEVGICTGVYNVQTGTCNPPCTNCEGVTAVDVTPNPADCPVGQNMQLTATAYYYNGNQVNVTNQASWSSSDNSQATVSATGMMTGVAGGSPTITALLQNQPTGGRVCNCIGCPPNRNFETSTIVTVQVPTYLSVASNISSGPASCPAGQAGPIRVLMWQVEDQNSDPIKFGGMPFHDEFAWQGANACNPPREHQRLQHRQLPGHTTRQVHERPGSVSGPVFHLHAMLLRRRPLQHQRKPDVHREWVPDPEDPHIHLHGGHH